MREKNHGVIERRLQPKDWRAGGVTGLTRGEILRADGQWGAYGSAREKQHNQYFDTMSCVSYGNIDPIEALMYRQFGKKVNFSDRFIAKMSGTTPEGNDEYTVAETIRKCGLVEEDAWPFGPWVKDRETYYSDIPQEVKDEGLSFLKEYKLNYQYIDEQNQDAMIEALKYSPLTVFIPGHCLSVYEYRTGEAWKCWEQYGDGFREFPWDYKFRCAVEWQVTKIIPKEKPMVKLYKNGMIAVVDEQGGRFMFIDGGKLFQDEPGSIETELQIRNATVDADGITRTHGYPVAHVKTAELVQYFGLDPSDKDAFAKIPRVNLKNEPLN